MEQRPTHYIVLPDGSIVRTASPKIEVRDLKQDGKQEPALRGR